jgi:hypothetical protein
MRFTDSMVYIKLQDGREVGSRLGRFPWLEKATVQQRARWSIEPHGYAVWWADLDGGIGIIY